MGEGDVGELCGQSRRCSDSGGQKACRTEHCFLQVIREREKTCPTAASTFRRFISHSNSLSHHPFLLHLLPHQHRSGNCIAEHEHIVGAHAAIASRRRASKSCLFDRYILTIWPDGGVQADSITVARVQRSLNTAATRCITCAFRDITTLRLAITLPPTFHHSILANRIGAACELQGDARAAREGGSSGE